jgi:hypothetical protein
MLSRKSVFKGLDLPVIYSAITRPAAARVGYLSEIVEVRMNSMVFVS